MSSINKIKKMVVKIPRHPYMNVNSETVQERILDIRVRKCRVHVERLNCRTVSLKPKRCIVRVARLPDVERSEISVTPASSIVCSEYEENDEAAK